MSNINVVVLSGRLTRDPELKTLASGKTVTSGSIAVNRKYGETEQTAFVEFKAWDKTGQILAEYTKKASRISIKGRLEQENWENEEGKKFSKLVVVVEDFELLDKKEE